MSLPDLYSALADPTRLRVLEMLHAGAKPVHQLAAAFDISRPAISRHLRVLKEAGLVKEEKQGRENLYAFQSATLKPAMAWLEAHQLAAAAPKGKPKAVRRTATAPAELKPQPKPKAAKPQPAAKAEPVAAKAKPTKAKPTKPVAVEPAAAPQLSFFDL